VELPNMSTTERPTDSTESPPAGEGLGSQLGRITRLTGVYVCSSLVVRAVSLCLLPVFTTYLSPDDYGLVALVSMALTLMSPLASLGLVSAIKGSYLRAPAGPARQQVVRATLTANLGFGIITAGAALILMRCAGQAIVPGLPLWPYFAIAAVSVVLRQSVALWQELLQLEEKATYFAVVQVALEVGAILLSLLTVVGLGMGALGRVLAINALYVPLAALALWCVMRRGGGPRLGLSGAREQVLIGVGFLPHTFSLTMAGTVDRYLLNRLANRSALGVYSVAGVFAQLVNMALTRMHLASYPTAAGLLNQDTEESRQRVERLNSLLLLGMTFVALAMAILGPALVRLAANSRFHAAAHIVPIMSLGWLLQGVYMIVGRVLLYRGKGGRLSVASISSVAVSAAANLMLIPVWGIRGAAWAMVAAYGVRLIIAFVLAQRTLPLRHDFAPVLKALSASAAVYAVAGQLSMGGNAWSALGVGVVGLAAALALAIPLRLLRGSELSALRGRVLRLFGGGRRS